jgi:aryl-alcohol dehydrogenase-like predicted oxidoreductase
MDHEHHYNAAVALQEPNRMKTRSFGRDPVQVSEVGLGTWQLGAEWGDVSDEAAAETLKAAFDHGVTFFDTADIYGGGKSESRIGKFLSTLGPRKNDVFIATKLGRSSNPGWPQNFSLESFRTFTEGSLQRLGVEAVDLTQTHCLPHDEVRPAEMFGWLKTLQSEGKIKRFGASVETMQEANECLDVDGLASLQIIFNVFRQKPIAGLFERAKEKGVAIIVRLPLASGLLSGKFKADSKFAENDHRNFNKDGEKFSVGETFAGLPLDKGVQLVTQLRGMIPAAMTMSQFAMRWILDFDAVTVVIPGAKSAKQVVENCSASEIPPLPASLHDEIADFYSVEVAPSVRGAQ